MISYSAFPCFNDLAIPPPLPEVGSREIIKYEEIMKIMGIVQRKSNLLFCLLILFRCLTSTSQQDFSHVLGYFPVYLG